KIDQKLGIPVGADVGVVERDVERLLALQRQIHDDAIDLGPALMLQDLQSLMAGDDMSGALVPDDRLHERELVERTFETLPGRRAWPQRNARVVRSGAETIDRHQAECRHGIQRILET